MKLEDDSGAGVGPLGQPPALDLDCPFNPFKNNSLPWRWLSWETILTLIMLPICLIRVALWISCMVLGYVFTKLAMIGAKDVLTKPFPRWRRPLLYPVRALARTVLFACGFQWIMIKGKPASREQAPILVSNHISFADPVFIFYRHLPVIVTAHENLLYPVAGSIMKAMQAISVNRISEVSRRNASGEIKRRAMCNDWSHLMIFPEATTTNGKGLVTFKTGAFTPGYPVQPMVIRYPHVHLDPSWVAEGPHVVLLLFRLMTQFHNFMEVEYLPIIYPTFQEQKNPRMFADRVRLTMAKALNVMVTEHGYEDAALAVEAVNRNVESGIALLEYTKFERAFHVNGKATKHFFSKFAEFGTFSKLPPDARGIVTYEDYLKAIAFPDCGTVQQLYRMFDRNGTGYFNFKQYTLGLAFVLKHPKFKEASEAIFKDCDKDLDGLIELDDLGSSLREIIPSVADQQILRLYGKVDSKEEGAVSKADFLLFLEANPEFVALFLIAKPRLMLDSVKDKKWELSNGGGKDS
jgi:lysophosphatidylcholine acyltransferase/lyso-PAF acetyltransferase